MATKKTKKLSAQTTTTTVATGEKFAKVDANGKVTLISLDSIRNAILTGISLDAIEDGVFIVFHEPANNHPKMVSPRKWPKWQNNGNIAEGVAIMEGGRILVVAPTESPVKLSWSSAAVSSGGVSTGDRVIAMSDWDGKSNTASVIGRSSTTAITNADSYAPGFCHAYSKANANGKGLTAGKWWLPSLGEMLMVYANLLKINHALSLINGATLLGGWYWTSTENGASRAWRIDCGDGGIYCWDDKSTTKGLVRPVSTFI